MHVPSPHPPRAARAPLSCVLAATLLSLSFALSELSHNKGRSRPAETDQTHGLLAAVAATRATLRRRAAGVRGSPAWLAAHGSAEEPRQRTAHGRELDALPARPALSLAGAARIKCMAHHSRARSPFSDAAEKGTEGEAGAVSAKAAEEDFLWDKTGKKPCRGQ